MKANPQTLANTTMRSLSTPEIEARYPNLLRAMQSAALLSRTEAIACIRDHRDGYRWSGEAVNHFGGVRKVLQAAYQHRSYARGASQLGSRQPTVMKRVQA